MRTERIAGHARLAKPVRARRVGRAPPLPVGAGGDAGRHLARPDRLRPGAYRRLRCTGSRARRRWRCSSSPPSPDPLWGIAYLVVSGAGTIAGMMLVTAASAVPFAYTVHRFPAGHR